MTDRSNVPTIKGERSMSQGFVAQYAAEAALQADGVARLDTGVIVTIKEAIGGEHVGSGIRVHFRSDEPDAVSITVYPVVLYGRIMPDVAWNIQERVKADVERYTGLMVDAVNVHIRGVTTEEDEA